MNKETISSALEWVERETNLRTKQGRMLSNGIQGEMLQLLSRMIQPSHILEIGTFTGYSTICLAAGLAPKGHIDTLEIDDELEDIIREGYHRAGLTDVKGESDKVRLHIGDARAIIPALSNVYDLVYIDANKREYIDYYNLVFDKVRAGGFILADNVLWNGKAIAGATQGNIKTKSIISFNDMISQDTRIDYITFPVRDGLSVIRKK